MGRPGRPKGSRNKRGPYVSIFDSMPPVPASDFEAVGRMQKAREFERKALRLASFRREAVPPPLAEPAPAPVEGPRVYVYVIIGNGDGAADPGQISEGHYTITGDVVRVEDMEGRSLGTQALRPGENAATVAKQILRKGAPNEFWRPLPARVYPGV
jgi:hypothetical protein